MDAIDIICFVIFLLVALIMTTIGAAQIRSRTPVAFYSGEKPFEEKELSDVSMWNKKHGLMWISYGITILLSYVVGTFVAANSVWYVIFIVGGTILPIFVMIWYHHRLIRLYQR